MGLLNKANVILTKLTGCSLVPKCNSAYIDRVRAAVLSGNHVDLLLDVGANNGRWAEANTPEAYSGNILSVEPITAMVEQIRQRAQGKPKWHIFQGAVGDSESQLEINISANFVSSSLLDTTSKNLSHFGEGTRYVGKETVRVAPLDTAVTETVGRFAKGWMKIDTQGFEDQVLRGAQETLKNCVGVEMELTGVEAYAGAPRMGQLVTMLVEEGFEMISIDHISYNNRVGLFAMGDALFVRPSFPIEQICPK